MKLNVPLDPFLRVERYNPCFLATTVSFLDPVSRLNNFQGSDYAAVDLNSLERVTLLDDTELKIDAIHKNATNTNSNSSDDEGEDGKRGSAVYISSYSIRLRSSQSFGDTEWLEAFPTWEEATLYRRRSRTR